MKRDGVVITLLTASLICLQSPRLLEDANVIKMLSLTTKKCPCIDTVYK